jgi:hypothetical protein
VVRAGARDGHHIWPTLARARPRGHATKEDVEERADARGAGSLLRLIRDTILGVLGTLRLHTLIPMSW